MYTITTVKGGVYIYTINLVPRQMKQTIPPWGAGEGGGHSTHCQPLTKYHIKLTYTQHVNSCSSLHRLSLDVDPPVLKEEVGIREHVHCVRVGCHGALFPGIRTWE